MCTCMRVCVCAQSLQSCPTLCDPMASSPQGFFVHGILLARKLEWVAISSFRGYSWLRDRICVSYVSCIGWQVFFLSLTLPGKPYTHIYMCIHIYVCVHAKLLQSCPTLCDPMDYSPPGPGNSPEEIFTRQSTGFPFVNSISNKIILRMSQVQNKYILN